VDQTAQESEPFSHVAAVPKNVFPGDLAVDRQELGHIGRLRKKVCGMAELGCLHDYRSLEIKDVLGPKEIQTASTSAELLVEERVVVGFPGDQSNVEIARHSQTSAEFLEVISLDWHRFQARSNLIEGLGKLPETMMEPAGFCNLFSNV